MLSEMSHVQKENSTYSYIYMKGKRVEFTEAEIGMWWSERKVRSQDRKVLGKGYQSKLGRRNKF
jgi:hypothetical protein